MRFNSGSKYFKNNHDKVFTYHSLRNVIFVVFEHAILPCCWILDSDWPEDIDLFSIAAELTVFLATCQISGLY